MKIDFVGLSVHRSNVLAVRAASGLFAAGRWTGLIGANGSGKTSLLRAVAGRLQASAGTIRIGGEELSADRAARAARIGYAPDIAALPEKLSPGEYLALVQRSRSAAAAPERLAELQAVLGIDALADRDFGQLSAGMKQRVAIFTAFAGHHAAVILDEPFNWLDPVCAFETKAALRRLVSETGLTLVTALHEVGTLTLHCDRGLLLAGGTVRRTLEGEELRAGARDLGAFERSIVDDLRASFG